MKTIWATLLVCFLGIAPAADIVVSSLLDSGPGTLRQAILDANATPEADRITFALPGAGPHRLQPEVLPIITSSVEIDGYSQAGSVEASVNSPAVLKVELDGSVLATNVNNQYTLRFSLAANESAHVQGLAIFGGEIGLYLTGQSNVVRGCWFGLDAAGVPRPDTYDALQLLAARCQIGGPLPGDQNVFVSDRYPIYLPASHANQSNQIINNRFGTDPTGMVSAMSSNAVNGATGSILLYVRTANNLIEGNQFAGGRRGMQIHWVSATNNVVRNNRWSVDATGDAPILGMEYDFLCYSPHTQIEDNQFGPCRYHSLYITGRDAHHTVARNNTFGLNASGGSQLDKTGRLYWAYDLIAGSSDMLVEDNTLAGGEYGLYLHSVWCSNTVVQANRIGTDVSGLQPIPHLAYGMRVYQARNSMVRSNLFGRADTCNLYIDHANTWGNTIANNSFGIPAGGVGVLSSPYPFPHTDICLLTHSNVIENNVIGGGGFGISISGAAARDNLIRGNQIGVDLFGNPAPLDNPGITVSTDAGLNQIISNRVVNGNGLGILLNGCTNNLFQANTIGVAADGSAAPNTDHGILVLFGSQNNLLFQNEIAYNHGAGILVVGTNTLHNTLSQNAIHHNLELGIDLAPETADLSSVTGVTPPDAGDGDTGGNALQNAPQLSYALSAAGSVSVPVELQGPPLSRYTIEYFSSASELDNDDEGQTYLFSETRSTDASGTAMWTRSITGPPPGVWLSATATSDSGNTSEFSPAVLVNEASDIQVGQSISPANPAVGDTVTITLTAQNLGPGQALALVFTQSLEGLSYINASGVGAYDPLARTWVVDTLPPLTSAQLIITATVQPSAGGSSLLNPVAFASGAVVDSTPANNSAGQSLAIACPANTLQGLLTLNGMVLPGLTVEARQNGALVDRAMSGPDGLYQLTVASGDAAEVHVLTGALVPVSGQSAAFSVTSPACGLDVDLQAAALNFLRLNEFVANNDSGLTDEDGDTEDWIELYNPTAADIDLSGYRLSDDSADSGKWVFPSMVLAADSYLVLFASGKDRLDPAGPLHASFKLSTGGEYLGLFNPAGTEIDAIAPAYPAQIDDISYGRWQGDWAYLEPTPNAPNQVGSDARLPPPVADLDSGFFDTTQTVGFAPVAPSVKIHYTVDGREPTENDPFIVGPVTITDRSADPNVYSEIPSSFQVFGWLPSWSPPAGLVQKATVFRAKSFAAGFEPSKTQTWTWLVDPAASNLYQGLPVVSLVSDPANLFEDLSGIMVPGITYSGSARSGNYFQEWERTAHVTFFETDRDAKFSQETKIKISGSSSPASPQKGLHIIADGDYGPKSFDYPIFHSSPGHARDLPDFKRFILRAYSSDVGRALITDAFSHRTAFPSGTLATDYRACVVFINGEFWGLNEIREHNKNSHYLEQHTGDDRDDPGYDMIQYNYGPASVDGYNVDEGTFDEWLDLMDFLDTNPVSVPGNYDIATNRIDVADLIAYTGIEIYSGNVDWPVKNDAQFRPRRVDGKWRFLLFDMDHSYSGITQTRYATDLLARTLPGGSRPHPVLVHMVSNATFQVEFINWFADAMNSYLRPEILHAELELMADEIRPTLPEHIHRWGFPDPAEDTFETWIQYTHDFIDERPAYMIQHLTNWFGLGGQQELTLSLSDPSMGDVQINSLMLGQLPGADAFPWTGHYFEDVPVTLTATPRPGYLFTGWTGATNSLAPRIQVSVDMAMAIQANFVIDPVYLPALQDHLLISEIHYHPAIDSDAEFIEFHNRGSSALDIGGLTLTGAVDFVFPPDASLPPGGFIVVVEDKSTFIETYSNATVVVAGSWDGRLNDAGEELVLVAGQGTELLRFAFDDATPWPLAADGDGRSLELIDPAGLHASQPQRNATYADGWSWRASCQTEGSPGQLSTCNTAPEWGATSNQTVAEDVSWVLPLQVDDRDVPAQTLTSSLISGPTGMSLVGNSLQWTPTELQGPSSNLVSVLVSDDGSPVLSSTQMFWVSVVEVNRPPVAGPASPPVFTENSLTTFLVPATDPDLPQNSLSFDLINGPPGLGLDPATGLLSWTPTETQGPGSYPVSLRVTDDGVPPMISALAFTVVVAEDQRAPLAITLANRTITEGAQLQVNAATTDPDLPAQTLQYSLTTAPTAATINAAGQIAWQTTEADGPGVHPFMVEVSDGSLLATYGFTVTVQEQPTPPVLLAPAAMTVAEKTLLRQNWFASDADLPSQTLGFSLIQGPSGAQIDAQTGVFLWMPTESQGPGSHTVEVEVSDGALVDRKTISLTVTESNEAPVIVIGPVTNCSIAKILIPAGSEWSYLDTGIDPGGHWIQPAFDDRFWLRGKGQLGYGDGDETTRISFGSDLNNRHLTTWFRRGFFVDDTYTLQSAVLHLLRDDGAAVYLNGVEIVRSNLPAGPLTTSTTASSSIFGSGESIYHPFSVPASAFRPGYNTLAVEVHQRASNSNDLSFDLKLNAQVLAPCGQPLEHVYVSVGSPVSLDLDVIDPDGGASFFSLLQHPGNLSLGLFSGLLSGAFPDAGLFSATVQATDPGTPSITSSASLQFYVSGPLLLSENALRHNNLIQWPSTPGLHYEVDYCDDLTQGPWMMLQSLTATLGTSSVVDPGASPMIRRFYRVRQVP